VTVPNPPSGTTPSGFDTWATTVADEINANTTELAGLPGTYVTVVEHDDDPDVARPVGAQMVVWVGTVNPNNAEPGDVRVNPDGTVEYLPLTGGTLTGPLTLDADPATAMQAATRQYVDTVRQASIAAADLGRLVAWDTFDRADGGLGTSDSGHTWTKFDASTAWEVSGNRARKLAGAAGAGHVIDPGVSNVDVEMSSVGGRLVFRYIDASNHLYLVRTSSIFELRKVDGGSVTGLGSSPYTASMPSEVRMRVKANGTFIQCWADGVLIISHTLAGGDATKYLSATPVGFHQSGNPHSVDDFVVRQVRVT
jgi:hypothetical protein